MKSHSGMFPASAVHLKPAEGPAKLAGSPMTVRHAAFLAHHPDVIQVSVVEGQFHIQFFQEPDSMNICFFR